MNDVCMFVDLCVFHFFSVDIILPVSCSCYCCWIGIVDSGENAKPQVLALLLLCLQFKYIIIQRQQQKHCKLVNRIPHFVLVHERANTKAEEKCKQTKKSHSKETADVNTAESSVQQQDGRTEKPTDSKP